MLHAMLEKYIKVTLYVINMVTIGKPKSITVTIRDRKSNKSKSITIYNASLEDVTKKVEKALKELEKG